MTINGKQDGVSIEDLRACGEVAGLKRGRASVILKEMTAVVAQWTTYAAQAGVPRDWRDQIQEHLRLQLPEQ
jgi:serine/threonine-protein kinase HipA